MVLRGAVVHGRELCGEVTDQAGHRAAGKPARCLRRPRAHGWHGDVRPTARRAAVRLANRLCADAGERGHQGGESGVLPAAARPARGRQRRHDRARRGAARGRRARRHRRSPAIARRRCGDGPPRPRRGARVARHSRQPAGRDRGSHPRAVATGKSRHARPRGAGPQRQRGPRGAGPPRVFHGARPRGMARLRRPAARRQGPPAGVAR